MSEDSKKARRPPGYKPFWESEEEKPKEVPPSSSYDWTGLKKRIFGDKLAADVAEEEARKLKERYNK